VIAAVELDHEMGGGVVKIRPPDKLAGVVVQIYLHARSGQTSRDQKPPKACFHWGFGGGGQLRQSSKSRGARPTADPERIALELLSIGESRSHRHVKDQQCIERCRPGTHVQ
jgi:hypothetical protein